MAKRVLLISPAFFGYEKKIIDSLLRLNFEVEYVDERPSNSVSFKFIQRLGPKFLTRNKTFKYYNEKISELKCTKYDVALFINIESIDESILELFSKRLDISKRILYMWDSSKNKPEYPKLIKYFDSAATFDPFDSESFGLKYLPLFYSKKHISNNARDIDVSFIGTVHSDRFLVASKVINAAKERGLSTFVYFYYPSRFLFFIRCLFDRNISFSARHIVHYSPMKYDEYCDIIERSKYVLDINHIGQHGFTMRTIEALGAGTKVLTTNKSILKSKLYQAGVVSVIDRNNPLFNIDTSFDINKVDIEEYYIDNWIIKLIE